MRRNPAEILIYCDDPRHPERKRLVAVTNFLPIHGTEGRWQERFTRARHDGKSSGTTLNGDARLRPGELMDSRRDGRALPLRSQYELECRKCRRKVSVREAALFAALNRLASAGVSRVTLAGLGAIVAGRD